jgi:excisionase family DNA binding protein
MTAAGFVQGVLIPPRVCLFLENNLPLTALRGRTRGDDPEIDKTLLDLRGLAMAYRENTTAPTTSGVDPARSHLLTPGEAAARLGITEDAIRAAIRRNRLPATKHAGRWTITAADLDTYLGHSA